MARCVSRKFVASLSQTPPIGSVLPVQPTNKCFAVYYLIDFSYHGMEEVSGFLYAKGDKKTPGLN